MEASLRYDYSNESQYCQLVPFVFKNNSKILFDFNLTLLTRKVLANKKTFSRKAKHVL